MQLEQIFAYSFIQAATIIMVVVALDSFWHIQAKYHPLTLFRLLALRLDAKVNHPSRGKLQNRIAGSLGFVSLTLPLFLILYFVLEIVHFRWFFDGLILLVAISSVDRKNLYRRTYKHLSKENKILARECLSALVLRKTERLTPIGCAKAAMESSTLRFYYHFANILFWFFFVGPLFALFVRLVSEFHQNWNCRLTKYQHFGAPIAKLNSLFQWLPCALHCLFFSMLYRPLKTLKPWFAHVHKGCRQLVLATTAYSLPSELGGPAIYNNKKVRFPRHCENIEVKLGHMIVLRKYLYFLTIVLMTSYTLLAVALYSVDFVIN